MLSMKPALLMALMLFFAALVPQHVEAREHDVSTWTKEKVGEFMEKYKIRYDKNMERGAMLRTLKSYRDSAATNAQLFGDKIDQITSNLRAKLEKQNDLSENNLNVLIMDLQHNLRQLELQGELSRDRVRQTLDRMHRHLIRRKIVTEAQWRSISNEVGSSFETQTWYQRVLGRPPTDVSEGSNSLNRWLQRISEQVKGLKVLSEEQVSAVVDQVRQSISIKDLSRLGDTHWIQSLGQRLVKNAKLTQDQADQVIKSVESDVNAYKIFAMEYTGQTVEQSKHTAQELVITAKQYCHGIIQRVYDLMAQIDGHLRQVWPFSLYQQRSLSVSEKIQHSKSSAVLRASRTVASATSAMADKTGNWKHSFAEFWREKELNAYRRLGYTEGQIDHIHRYLAKTFKRDHQSMGHKHVDEALHNLKRYLQDTHVQSTVQVQHQVDKLHKLFDSWKEKATKSK